MIYKIAEEMVEEHETGDIVLEIRGMTGRKCEDAVKAAVLKCNGVKDARVCHKKCKATVKVKIFKVDVNELKDVVEDNGFTVVTVYFYTEI